MSTASLVIGVAAAQAGTATVLLSGIAGLVAGAMSMAAGEYVSVHSQSDSEAADLAREHTELQARARCSAWLPETANELAGPSRGCRPRSPS